VAFLESCCFPDFIIFLIPHYHGFLQLPFQGSFFSSRAAHPVLTRRDRRPVGLSPGYSYCFRGHAEAFRNLDYCFRTHPVTEIQLGRVPRQRAEVLRNRVLLLSKHPGTYRNIAVRENRYVYSFRIHAEPLRNMVLCPSRCAELKIQCVFR